MKQYLTYILLFISHLTLAQNGISLINQALELTNKHQYKQASQKINEGINYFSDSYILCTATNINILAKNYNKAYTVAQRLNEPDRYLAIAKIFVAEKQFDSAYTYLSKYLFSKDKAPEYVVKNDSLLSKMCSTKQWQRLWSRQWYDSLYISLDRLESQARYGDGAQALARLEKLNKTFPDNWRIHYLMAEAYISMEAKDQAINQLTNALKYKKNDYGLLIKLANLYAQAGHYQNAALTLEKTYKLYPYHLELLPEIADNYAHASEPDKAIAALNKYLKYKPDDEKMQYKLAKINYINHQYLNTIRIINNLMDKKQKQDNYKYFTIRGKAYFHTHSYKNAYYDLTMSLDLYPYQPELYRLIGQAAYFIGHKKEACLYWQRSYKLFHDREAQKMINQICKKQ